MALNWLRMTRKTDESWRRMLYQSPVDPLFERDSRALRAMIASMVAARINDEAPEFDELGQAAGLLSRLRLFLHIYLSLSTPLRADLEAQALDQLQAFNRERTQIQALSLWALSSQARAPAAWKAAMRRRGMSAMPWRAAVSFAEDERFAADYHWVRQYQLDRHMQNAADNIGDLSRMTDGLRARDGAARGDAAAEIGRWLKSVRRHSEAAFLGQGRMARRLNFNQARIDASDAMLEVARDVARERAPELARAYFSVVAPEGREAGWVWHDRYAGIGGGRGLSWKDAKAIVLKVMNELDKDVGARAKRIFKDDLVEHPQGRGGGFTTPLFFSRTGRHDAGPFVYAPFDGSMDSVRTLTHEMGHAVHASLSAPRGVMLADAGWAVGEAVALTFETLLMKADLRGLADQDFAMLAHQPAVYEFERRLCLSDETADIDGLWVESMGAHYGEAIALEGYETFWQRHTSILSSAGYPAAYLLGWALAGLAAEKIGAAEGAGRAAFVEVLKQGGEIGYDDAAEKLGVRDPLDLLHGAYDRAHDRLRRLSAG